MKRRSALRRSALALLSGVGAYFVAVIFLTGTNLLLLWSCKALVSSRRGTLVVESTDAVIVIAAVIWAVRSSWLAMRRDDRYAAFQCTGCGYELQGNESGTCPECGQSTLIY